MQHEHEVIEEFLDVEVDAGRRQVELVGAHGGDDGSAMCDGGGEERPWVSRGRDWRGTVSRWSCVQYAP